jgi:putative glutamine amidotransferase
MAAIPGETPACWVVGQRYIQALVDARATPWLVPLLADNEPALRDIYQRLNGLLLAGGPDVEPRHYGEQRRPNCGRGDPARDEVELIFLRWAIADGRPVLAICRGAQLLNVALGGTLFQDIPSECPNARRHACFAPDEGLQRDSLVHAVHPEPRSRLASLLGPNDVLVNSLHHQGIKSLAPALRATAFSPDGLIEAVEPTNGAFLLGVQWHPEELTAHEPHRRLFEAFVSAAAGARRML